MGVLYNSGTESERRVTGVLSSNSTERLGRQIGGMSEDFSMGNVCGNTETTEVAESLPDSNAGREGEFSQGEVVVFKVQVPVTEIGEYGILLRGSKIKRVVVTVGISGIYLKTV